MPTRIVDIGGDELAVNADGSINVGSTSVGSTVTVVQGTASLLNSTATISGSASIFASSTSASVTVRQSVPSLNQSQTQFQPLTAATYTSVASSASSVALSAANTSRRKISIANPSTAILYVGKVAPSSIASTLTSINFSFSVAANGYYEEPQPVWQGLYNGIWGSANGQANITEGT